MYNSLKETYEIFTSVVNSLEFKDLSKKFKVNSINDVELARLDYLISQSMLKTNSIESICNSLFQKNKKFKLNNGATLKITRGRTRNDSGICFKVSNEVKSNKLEYKDLIDSLYGLRVNYFGEVYTEYISDEFKSECDLIVRL